MYPSSNFLDDLAFGAAWMYRKTGEEHFLDVSFHPVAHLNDASLASAFIDWDLNWILSKISLTQGTLLIEVGSRYPC